MKLYFDNIFGHQTDGDLLFSVVSAEFDKNEWNYAFENGWSPIGIWYNRSKDILWYQSRQTRIDTKLHTHGKKTKILLNNYKYTKIFNDKFKTYNLLKKIKIELPKYDLLKNISSIDKILSKFGYPENSVIVKSRYGIGGRGVYFFGTCRYGFFLDPAGGHAVWF